jgi:hypothetical protein
MFVNANVSCILFLIKSASEFLICVLKQLGFQYLNTVTSPYKVRSQCEL